MRSSPISCLSRVVAGLLASCLCAALAHAAEATALHIEQAWLREPVPGRNVAALYMQVRNTGATAVRITGAELRDAKSAAIHQSIERDGMMRMRPVKALAVPAGGSVAMAPGGYHVMVFGLTRVVRSGERLPFCLRQVHGPAICAEATVKGWQVPSDG
jgi:periplasmic copper chaperone A